MPIAFDNSYARLPDRFYARLDPVPVTSPALITVNEKLSDTLGLDAEWLRSPQGLEMLSGNGVATGSTPIAQAYAGHQFGGFNPQLGDGRALLLGEVKAPDGTRWDIQLKGSGPTPFSRNGDGRAWLGPVLREYIVSEAMHAFGIPTTRALAAVSTGEKIQRETALPGAILTRAARSHIRVGTFQYFAACKDNEGLQRLTAYTLSRHFPNATGALGLLKEATQAQANLIAAWMSVGFVHGVMNTDNCHVAGDTIDYGPCAFMDRYHPATVFSSIDRRGRYAYQNQPDIAVWNLAQLATALVPLLAGEEGAAVAEATEVLHGFGPLFHTAWCAAFRAKLGLHKAEEEDGDLIADLLQRVAEGSADFTNTFRALGSGKEADQFADPAAFAQWEAAWHARLARDGSTAAQQAALRARANPALIPRNHRVEQAIEAAVTGDFAPFHRLNTALATPFELADKDADLSRPAQPDEEVLQTFCGT